MEILARINREDGCTVIVSLHQVDMALKYCPRVVALHQGRVVFDGPSKLLTPQLLRELYGVHVDEILADSNRHHAAPVSLVSSAATAVPAWRGGLAQAA
jgi:phosphonate transport system ATP-binding protein